MDHQPEPLGLIGLQLYKMIAAPQGGEFQDPGRIPEPFQSRITQHHACKIGGHWNRPPLMTTPSRYRVPQASENSTCRPRLVNHRCLDVKRNSQHSTTNVPANGLWVNELACGNRHANTHISSQMNIGHHGNALDIRRPPQAPDGI
ncbi:MAG TPA: hypothetical protein VNO35_22695 [Steroidobacteraceae bacterium]|nr:hypothetical protein [Steroidobacteraceae bacterium]